MKKDIKYIIKRIIIGVGIALILGFLHKNHVFAEENTTATCFGPNMTVETCNSSSEEHIFIDTFSGQLKIGSRLYNSSIYNNIFSFKNSDNDYLVIDDALSISSANQKNVKQFGFIEQKVNNQNTYSMIYSNNFDNIDNNYVISGSGRFMFISQDLTRRDNFYQNYISLNNTSSSNYSRLKITHNGEDYYIFMSYYAYDKYYIDPEEWNYLYSSDNFPDLDTSKLYYINENFEITDEIPSQSIDFPYGYSQISLNENQGVYFIPKKYNDIQIETIQTGGTSEFPLYTNYIDFNYYFKGSVKDGYFPLNNIDDLYIKNMDLFSDEYVYIDSYFPMYENGSEQTGYQFYSYIIFTNDIDTSYIYYNSLLFDYYIIDDISNYQKNVCFIDRDDEEICIDLDFKSSIDNWWIKGFIDDNDGFVGGQDKVTNKINNFFDILKLPFNWLKSLTNYSCSSINLPIPFIGGNIEITCLSSIFKRVLGNDFYNIIFYILTGIYAYRITVRNIDTITDTLNPNDDKLEVLDL